MCKNQRENNFSSNGDYRKSHLGDKQATFYESNVYNLDTFDSALWEREKEILIRIIRKYLKGIDINYLDFACGSGRIISFLEKRVKKSIGVDVSENMLEIAKSKVEKSQLIIGDITKERTLVTGEFNLITCFRFFLNAQDSLRYEALEAISQKLSKDGILILNIHGNKYSPRFLSVFLRKYFLDQKINQLSFWEMKKILEKHNFMIIDFKGLGFVTPKLYKLLPKKLFDYIEKALEKVKVLNYFAVNLILVCKKVPKSQGEL